MNLRVALQMDALSSINPRTDSTLKLGLEAGRRGYEVWQYTPDKLFYQDGKVMARAARVALHDNPEHWFDEGETTTVDMQQMDVVWLRQDPPFDMAYITTTYMLERIHPKTFVVNNPASVRNLPEKWFPTELAQFTPPTLIAADAGLIAEFQREHGDVIIKPLYGHAGHGIFRLDKNAGAVQLERLFAENHTPVVAQKFLPEMKDAERRIILIDGKFAAIAGRIPAEGQMAAASRLGGKYVKAEATKRQMEICEALSPLLKSRGLIYVGLDVIGDWLTEVNITSPTSIPPINALYGLTLESDVWDAVERYLP